MFSDRPGGLRIDRWLYWRRMTGEEKYDHCVLSDDTCGR